MSGKTAKPKLKTVKAEGMTLTYHPSAGNERVTGKVIRAVAKKRLRREALAAQRAAAPPPDLSPKKCLVAYIDILGFGAEIRTAETETDLRRAYTKIKTVQKEFQKVSAADDPKEQQDMNAVFGRRVIALSYAVVVIFSSTSPARSMMGSYDHFGSAVAELLAAQARCLLNHGIFVRGGLSHGAFYFEDDVLLSPALARAYELESRCAEHPVIAVTAETREALLQQPERAFYAPGADPTPQFFRRHGRRKVDGRPVYFLDYLSSALSDVDPWLDKADHDDYLDAKRKRDHVRAQAALDRDCAKGTAAMLRRHRTRIEEAYHSTDSERARRKYRWLMRYHNRSFRKDVKSVRDEVIDLSRFEPVKSEIEEVAD